MDHVQSQMAKKNSYIVLAKAWCQLMSISQNIYMQSLFSLKVLIFLHHNQLASNQTPLLLTNRHWLLLSCPYSSLKMRWRMKVATHFSLTSSLHEVHTDCNHSIRAVNRHMSWRMRISALFSWTCPSLEFTADLKMNLMLIWWQQCLWQWEGQNKVQKNFQSALW